MAETARLTYVELGRRLGTNAEAARAMARRHRWPIERDNRGKAIVLAPVSELDQMIVRPNVRAAVQPVVRLDARVNEQVNAHPDVWVELVEWKARTGELREALEHEREVTRDQREELTDMVARTATAEAQVIELRAALDRALAEVDDLKRESRQPWWARLLGWPHTP